jgi:integrase
MGRSPGGKRLRKKLASKDPAELVKGLKRQIVDIDDGQPLPSARLTLEQFILNTWLPWKKRKVIEATYADYERTARNHIVPAKGKTPLTKLEAQGLEDWYGHLADGGVGARTILKVRNVISMALDYAVATGKLKRNVAALVEPPRYEPKPKLFYTEKQLMKLLQVAAGRPIFPLVLAAITTQIRPGELYALDWEHVDIENRVIEIRRTMTDTARGPIVGEKPKTKKALRRVRIPQILADAFGELKARSRCEHVFPSPDGKRLRRQNVQRRAWKPLLEEAGLPNISFYNLRSSGANIADKIPDMARSILSARMGHTDEKTTEIYLDPNVVLQTPIADRFDQILESLRVSSPSPAVPTAVPTRKPRRRPGKGKARS